MSDSHDLLVFHEKETEALLRRLGLLEQVISGQIKCIVCGKTITLENFGAIFDKKFMTQGSLTDNIDAVLKEIE